MISSAGETPKLPVTAPESLVQIEAAQSLADKQFSRVSLRDPSLRPVFGTEVLGRCDGLTESQPALWHPGTSGRRAHRSPPPGALRYLEFAEAVLTILGLNSVRSARPSPCGVRPHPIGVRPAHGLVSRRGSARY